MAEAIKMGGGGSKITYANQNQSFKELNLMPGFVFNDSDFDITNTPYILAGVPIEEICNYNGEDFIIYGNQLLKSIAGEQTYTQVWNTGSNSKYIKTICLYNNLIYLGLQTYNVIINPVNGKVVSSSFETGVGGSDSYSAGTSAGCMFVLNGLLYIFNSSTRTIYTVDASRKVTVLNIPYPTQANQRVVAIDVYDTGNGYVDMFVGGYKDLYRFDGTTFTLLNNNYPNSYGATSRFRFLNKISTVSSQYIQYEKGEGYTYNEKNNSWIRNKFLDLPSGSSSNYNREITKRNNQILVITNYLNCYWFSPLHLVDLSYRA